VVEVEVVEVVGSVSVFSTSAVMVVAMGFVDLATAAAFLDSAAIAVALITVLAPVVLAVLEPALLSVLVPLLMPVLVPVLGLGLESL
jgi:hypothetical protein